jgi:hypothetical protein
MERTVAAWLDPVAASRTPELDVFAVKHAAKLPDVVNRDVPSTHNVCVWYDSGANP